MVGKFLVSEMVIMVRLKILSDDDFNKLYKLPKLNNEVGSADPITEIHSPRGSLREGTDFLARGV